MEQLAEELIKALEKMVALMLKEAKKELTRGDNDKKFSRIPGVREMQECLLYIDRNNCHPLVNLSEGKIRPGDPHISKHFCGKIDLLLSLRY